VLAGCLLITEIAASQSANPPIRQSEQWSIAGQVQLGRRAGPIPVPNQWVVVHRISSDSAGKVSGGAVDSARSDARGRYRIRYTRSPGQATYIAITTYQGVSYISSPLNRPGVSGDDAVIMVFDTISPPYPIHVAGRHLVIAAPDIDDRRRVVEVFELLNDSTHTVMGTEANPVWRAAIPAGAKDVQIDPVGDISPAMTKVGKDWLDVFSPISPGIRQIAFSYTLEPDAFPLVVPVVDSATVFELLVQEPGAFIEGGGFTEVAAVMQDGVPFRRLLAQNVPPRSIIRFAMPKSGARMQSRAIDVVVVIVSLVMLSALVFLFWRRSGAVPKNAPTAFRAAPDALVRELAMLDAEFERRDEVSTAERAEYDARRAALKAQLNAALADPNGAG
jgi:hypothetical protein